MSAELKKRLSGELALREFPPVNCPLASPHNKDTALQFLQIWKKFKELSEA